VGMLRDRDAAADCVQDVFCNAATRLPQLREPDKLRPWLYAIARNEALRCIRDRRREQVSDELPDAASSDPGPDTLAARSELADLIAEAGGGLSDRDRSLLELAYRHGLDLSELAQALDVSYGSAKKMVQRLRDTIERSLGALLLARRGQTMPGACPELAQILDGWDGEFNILIRKRIARHAETCPTCDQNRSELVNPVALLGAVPVFIPAPGWLRDHTLSQVHLTSATADFAGPSAEATQARSALPSDTTESLSTDATETIAAPPPEDAVGPAEETGHDDAEAAAHLRRRLALLIGLLVGFPLLALGLTIVFLNLRTTPVAPINPINVTNTAPPPTNPAPAGTPTPAPSPNNPPSPPALTTLTQAPVVPATPTKPPPPPAQTSPAAPPVSSPAPLPPPPPPRYPPWHWPPPHRPPPNDGTPPVSTQPAPPSHSQPPPPPPPTTSQPPVIF
jgi:RNA polymerase sigma factor (sigma-70 family)